MMAALSAEWIAAQRWFRAKQRPIATVTQADHASVEHVELRVFEVAYRDGGPSDRYLVPTVDEHEPRDGEGAWMAIVRAMADNVELTGEHGMFACSRTDALAALLPSGRRALDPRDERRLRVEQSNTSVVLGDRLILKLYRLLEPGTNPDLEVATFLTDAGFTDTPAVAGAMTYADGSGASAAAMLQEFVPSRGDAWRVVLDALARDPTDAVAIVERIGATTSAMHAALASSPGHPQFPARTAGAADAAAWHGSAEGQLARALSAVGGRPRGRLAALAPLAAARFDDAFASAVGDASVSRIHGDYHLGQLLARTDGGFSVIDFEGEPARPLAERREPGSPLRDLAGMLRSLDYAARTSARDTGLDADGWLFHARRAFVAAYGDIGPEQQELLDAFELEKACYEVRYEANNRPDWLWLPLAALERVLADH